VSKPLATIPYCLRSKVDAILWEQPTEDLIGLNAHPDVSEDVNGVVELGVNNKET
tara:strand:+ start:6018 stop:6182 length:165 start_codon:yes stop_codon:yes gene_type:complete